MISREIYRDYSAMNTDFQNGLERLRARDEDAALDAFARADIRAPKDDVYKNKYRSFHGLMLVYAGQSRGIEMCRSAAERENFDGDVFHNLARAELRLNHRRSAIQALNKGLAVDATHPELLKLRRELGVRREPVFPFLSRNNFLNRWFGKLTYSRAR